MVLLVIHKSVSSSIISLFHFSFVPEKNLHPSVLITTKKEETAAMPVAVTIRGDDKDDDGTCVVFTYVPNCES